MAMCRQTVQRYGGFTIPAIFVRDAGEALSGGNTRQPLPVTRTGLVVTRALQLRKMNFYAAREENLLLSRGKYFFLGRKKITPPVDASPGYSGYTVTRLHGCMLHLCISHQK